MQNWQILTDIMPYINKMPKHKEITTPLDDIGLIFLENS
jgi:hypothetical protein